MRRIALLGWRPRRAPALWEVWAGRRDPLLYVPPSRVLPALGRVLRLEAYPTLLAHFGLTVLEVLVAYLLAVGLGLALGFALGLPRHVGEIYEPLLAALYAIPSVVWYPSLMLFFGLGPASKIAFGVLLGFFPIVLAVLAGIRSADPHLLTVARRPRRRAGDVLRQGDPARDHGHAPGRPAGRPRADRGRGPRRRDPRGPARDSGT